MDGTTEHICLGVNIRAAVYVKPYEYPELIMIFGEAMPTELLLASADIIQTNVATALGEIHKTLTHKYSRESV